MQREDRHGQRRRVRQRAQASQIQHRDGHDDEMAEITSIPVIAVAPEAKARRISSAPSASTGARCAGAAG